MEAFRAPRRAFSVDDDEHTANLRHLEAFLALFAEIFHFGSGTPEGEVIANVGAIYARLDGGASTTFYVKESGTAATGWVAK